MEVTLNDIIVSKSGNSTGGTDCNLYGQNAAVLVKDGAVATITNAQIVSTSLGSSGIFSFGGTTSKGDGTRVDIADTAITTTGNNSGGIATAGGGETHAQNLTINTSGEFSAPIKSDNGGGVVTVQGGTYVSTGIDSPAVHSMADISITEATLISHCSSGSVIQGKNKLKLYDCVVTANNCTLPHQALYKAGIRIYDIYSTQGTAELTVRGGTINNIEGSVIHVTNTRAKISLEDVEINNSDPASTLISIANDGWSGSENQATVDLKSMNVSGNIVVDNSPTAGGHESSSLDLSLSSSTIFKGSINSAIPSENRGTVNLTVKQGTKFILTSTSYVDSLVNNGKIVCGTYDLYVNGEKYDDGGSHYPSESTLVLDGTKYTVKDRYGKIKVTQDSNTKAITAVIKKSGQFVISGSGINTMIRIAQGVKNVLITLSELTIDNSKWTAVTGTDGSVMILEPEADAEITLQGSSTLTSSETYHELARAVIRGNQSNLIFNGSGTLRLIDPMPETTQFHDSFPDGISNPYGLTSFQSGKFIFRINGSAVRNTKGTINIEGATLNVEYSGQDSINTDDGIFNMSSGRLDVAESSKNGISASTVESENKGAVNITGGEVRLYKIAHSGIRSENVTITGGHISITNIFQQSANMIYVPGSDVPHKNTIYPINPNSTTIRINYFAGYHHGIEAGRRGKTYSYIKVPTTDEKHRPGETYTQVASGSLNITGGVIEIDTKITGLITNELIDSEFQPCSNNVYVVGDPGHGIMSYGTVAISGGHLTINAGGSGIVSDGTVTVTADAIINVDSAYVGIQASDFIMADNYLGAPTIKIDPVDSAIVTVKNQYTYIYDSSIDEDCNYSLHVTNTDVSNNFYSYGGTLTTLMDIYTVHSVILRSGPNDSYIKKEFKYKGIGHGISAKGAIYIDSGHVQINGPDIDDMIPVQYTTEFLVNKLATVIISGVDTTDTSFPKYGDCAFIRTGRSITWDAGTELKINTAEGNPIYRGTLVNAGSFLVVAHPEFTARRDYEVYLNENRYVLTAYNPIGGT